MFVKMPISIKASSVNSENLSPLIWVAPPSSQRPTQQMMGGHTRQESQRVPLVTVQPFNRQTDNEESAGQEVVCNCGTSALLLTVKKDGPNQGKI